MEMALARERERQAGGPRIGFVNNYFVDKKSIIIYFHR
jgi:hypothetical protein